MKQLVCEMCGSKDLVKQDGLFVCQSCGIKYSVEEARKMMIEGTVEVTGTVKIDSSASINNYLDMAKNAYGSNNNSEAEAYANRVLELAPTNYQAWLVKGKAAGWQSTLANPRFPECISAFTNALKYSPEEEKNHIVEDVKDEIINISCALVSVRADSFVTWASEDSAAGFFSDLTVIFKTIISFCEKDIIIPMNEIMSPIAEIINNAVIKAYENTIYPDYKSQKYPYPNDDDFRKYIQRIDNCITLLDEVNDFPCEKSEINIQIYKNMEMLQNKAIEACSYDWIHASVDLRNPMYADGFRQRGCIVDVYNNRVYSVKLRLNNEAKAGRKKEITRYLSAIEEIEAKQKKQVINAFWAKHQTEYKTLLDEKNKAEAELKTNKGYATAHALKKYISDINDVLEAHRDEKNVNLTSEDKAIIARGNTFWTSISSKSDLDDYLDKYPILKRTEELARKREYLIAQRREFDKYDAAKSNNNTVMTLKVVIAIAAIVLFIFFTLMDVIFLAVIVGVLGVIAFMFTSFQKVDVPAKPAKTRNSLTIDILEYNKIINEMRAVPKYEGSVNSAEIINIPLKIQTTPFEVAKSKKLEESPTQKARRKKIKIIVIVAFAVLIISIIVALLAQSISKKNKLREALQSDDFSAEFIEENYGTLYDVKYANKIVEEVLEECKSNDDLEQALRIIYALAETDFFYDSTPTQYSPWGVHNDIVFSTSYTYWMKNQCKKIRWSEIPTEINRNEDSDYYSYEVYGYKITFVFDSSYFRRGGKMAIFTEKNGWYEEIIVKDSEYIYSTDDFTVID